MRILWAAAISLALGIFVAVADDKKPGEETDPKVRAEKFAALKKKYESELSDLTTRLDRTEDPATVRGIQSELKELVALTAEKALAIARSNPKDDTGFAAAAFVVHAASDIGGGGKAVDSALALITENYAASSRARDLLLPATRLGGAGDKFLKEVAEKGADKETKGMASFLRGLRIAQGLDDEEDEKKFNAMVAEARTLIEKGLKDAPNARLGRVVLGEIARRQLNSLKNAVMVTVGKPAPDVETTTLEGKKVKLSDYKGKVVLLDIWATWCPPCRAMIPHERELVKKLAKRPFVLISVSADDEKEALVKFLEKEPMPWTHWWEDGGDNPVLKKYRVHAFPTLYLIDHTGVVKEKWVGAPGNAKIDRAVEEAVKEAEKAKG